MDIAFTEDQLQVRDAFSDLLGERCTPTVLRGVARDGRSTTLWSELAEIGVLDLLVPESAGGTGLDEVSMALCCQVAGYHGLPEPLVEHAFVAMPALVEAGHDLGAHLAGKSTLVASLTGQGPVGWAQWADHAVVPVDDHLGTTDDLAVEPVPETLDPTRPAARLGPRGRTAPLPGADSAAAFCRGAVGTAAQLVGLSHRMLDMTLGHVVERHQFGSAVGANQAIKHRLADVRTEIEYAAPLVWIAAWSLVNDPRNAAVHAAMAKATASDTAERCARAALQCHGAMGYSEEYDLHLFMRRTWALSRCWGSSAHHRRAIADHLAQNRDDNT